MPRQLLVPVILIKQPINRLKGAIPFEHLWMLSYIDKHLVVDSSLTCRELSWDPTPRKLIGRRLLFLIDNMQKHPDIWKRWNEAMLQRDPQRPYLVLHEMIYDALATSRTKIVESVCKSLIHSCKVDVDSSCILSAGLLNPYVRLAYQLIVAVIKTRDRPMMCSYAKTIAFIPLVQSSVLKNWSSCLSVIGNAACEKLLLDPQFTQKKMAVDNYVCMTINLAIDQIEDYYELLSFQSNELPGAVSSCSYDSNDFDRVISKLEDLCQEAISGQSWPGPLSSAGTNFSGTG
jgi:hypothetical protein